jgi:hypothetical protein
MQEVHQTIQDQFYEINNNSDSILYLDGIYFAALYPMLQQKISHVACK